MIKLDNYSLVMMLYWHYGAVIICYHLTLKLHDMWTSWVVIAWYNGLVPVWHQTNTWTNADFFISGIFRNNGEMKTEKLSLKL